MAQNHKIIELTQDKLSVATDLLPRLQALLTRWDEQAATAARKLERSKKPTGGAYYAGAMFGYEDCATFLTDETRSPCPPDRRDQNYISVQGRQIANGLQTCSLCSA